MSTTAFDLRVQLLDAGQPAAGDRLVGAGDDPDEPASACSGWSTGIAAMVVQFGLAMMPLRISASACGLTSLTTSGTSGSRRQAELLSMTVTPASANRGACALEVVAPAEKSAMSRPGGVGGGGVLDGDLAVAPRQGAAGRAGGGEEPQLG